MRLYFVRHGESEANVLNVISNRGYQHGLTEKGRQQAEELAHNLKDAQITRIYSSPLMRAVQTSEILSKAWGVGFTITDALREFDCGVLEDKSDLGSWKIWHRVWDDWQDRQQWDSRVEGGESHYDIRARFIPFIESLISQYGQAGEQIALVGHGGVYLNMLPLVLTNIDFPFIRDHFIINTGCVIAELQGDGKLLCSSWCGILLHS